MPVYYDPMLAKLVVSGESRSQCLARVREALGRFEVLGVRTNLAFLKTLVTRQEFVDGRIDTGYIDRHLADLSRDESPLPTAVAAAAAWHAALGGQRTVSTRGGKGAPRTDPFDTIRGWRG